ncbi:low molecular weight phosphatase family protein [Candidatus Dojkabacteria bacterium]|nr:low molecular weight phosphatase family protein [Candidatus Dojkabacteria bacterium]
MKVLFICKSNFGRSQIAEAIFNSISKKHKSISAGTEKGRVTDRKLEDFPEHSNLFICMYEIGLNIRENFAKHLTPEMVTNADKIIVMAKKEALPEYLKKSNKMFLWGIKDMCGQSLDEFRKVRDQIKELVEELINGME